MANIIVILIVAGIVALAGGYIHKSKKRGIKCVGCPNGATCGGCCSGCGEQAKKHRDF